MGAISSKSPHDALRQKTVMEIAMAAHATQRPYPNVKIVSPYPGRLLKARYKRMQKVAIHGNFVKLHICESCVSSFFKAKIRGARL